MKNSIKLTEKSSYDSFCFSDFVNPETFLGPVYFWVWNDKIDKETIKTQLKEMVEGGVRIVSIVPEPKSFRPFTMKTKMDPDYLTDEYWELYRFFIEETKKSGMQVWFYDEGGWPSGKACGKVVENRPDSVAKLVGREEIVFNRDMPESPFTIAYFNGDKRVLKPENGQKLTRYFYYELFTAPTKPDMPSLLDEKAVDEFIYLTHEGLRKACGDLLGNTVLATFTDEPEILLYPWTYDLAEDFIKTKGYDIRDYLPRVFAKSTDKKWQKVRVDFYDYWSARFARVYFGKLRQWGKANNVLSTGHVSGDDRTDGSAVYSFGHILRVLRGFDIPGVDVIWRQIFPAQPFPYEENSTPYRWENSGEYANHYFPRYASSAAHQQGLRWAMTETAGVYGAGLTFDQLHWVLAYQLVRGVNLFSIFGFSLGETGYLMAGERPVRHPKNPEWISLASFNDLLSRESYLGSLGSPESSVALYIPIRDLWANGPNFNYIHALHDRVAYKLERLQVGFDIFDDDVLEQGKIENGTLRFGGADYDVLIVPENDFIDKERLKKCADDGIRVVWIGEGRYEKPDNCIICDTDKLREVIPRLIQTDSQDIRVSKRRLDNGTLYMLFNEGLTEIHPEILFYEKKVPQEIDALNVCVRSVSGSLTEKGFYTIPRLASGECMYLLFSGDSDGAAPRFENVGEKYVLKDFSMQPISRFVIGENEFEEKQFNENPVKCGLGPWKDKFGEDFSGRVKYGCKFTLSEKESKKYRFLSLGKIEYSCKVSINGKVKDVFTQPYVCDVEGSLKAGENVLEIVVANTLANQFVYTKNFDRYDETELGPYFEHSKTFEKESLGGGLFGPVVLIEK